MNKLILKTASVTVVVLLVACLLTYGALAIFSPLTLSDFYFEAGLSDTSLKYAVRAYEKDDSTENLVKVIDRAIEVDDKNIVAEYCEKLFERDSFMDKGKLTFYKSKYCIALYKSGKSDVALEKAVEFSRGYLIGNPLEGLAVNAIESRDVNFLQLIKSSLYLLRGEALPENAARIDAQLEMIEGYIKSVQNAES